MKCPSKSLVALAVAATLPMLPMTAQAAAHAKKEMKKQKVEFKWSGQVSRAISYLDNGDDTDIVHVDNNNSGTRIRLRGKVDVGGGNSAGIRWETQYQDNSSGSIDVGDRDNASAFNSRYREAWFAGKWGKLYIGQGDGAANGTSEVDFSGTTIVDYSGQDLADGVTFVNSAGAQLVTVNPATATVTPVTLGRVRNNFDGLSRNDRLRYDSPKLGDLVTLSGDFGQDKGELAARFGGKIGAGKWGAAIAYVDTGATGTGGFAGSQIAGSASVLLGGGLSITVQAGQRDLDAAGRDDPTGFYIKVGQMFGAGMKNRVSISYQQVDDVQVNGDEYSGFRLAFVRNMKKGVELYAGFEHNELDVRGVRSPEDIDAVHAGTRIKF